MILGVSDPRRGTADFRIKCDSAGAKVLRTFSAEGVGLRPASGSQGGFSVRGVRNGPGAASSITITKRRHD